MENKNSVDNDGQNKKNNALARFGVHKPYTVFVAVIIVIILGVMAFTNLTTELFPKMDLPYAVVMTQAKTQKIDDAGNLVPDTFSDGSSMAGTDTTSAEGVEKLTVEIEKRLYSVSNVKQITSMSAQGISVAIIEFNSGTNVDFAQNDISSSIELLDYNKLGYQKPKIIKINPNMLPVFSFATHYKKENEAATNDWYNNVLIPTLDRIEGIATISNTFENSSNTKNFSVLDGEQSFSFTLNKASDYPTTEAVKNILTALDDLAAKNEGFTYTVTLDQGEYIDQAVGNVLNNLLMGGALAIVILFLFLRNVKMTVAIAISIPLCVVGTFVLMYFAGIGLNMVSMGGLALAVGMLVDNSIVVMENIYRLRQKGCSMKEAAIKGASQVLGAITASTLTTICVFLPMLFVQGLIMSVFLDMAYTIAFALFASLVVAVMFLPALISSLNIKQVNKKENKTVTKINKAYNKVLNFSLTHKLVTLIIVFVLFAGSIGLVFINGFSIMPATDEGQFTATVSISSLYKAELNLDNVAKGKSPIEPNTDEIHKTAVKIAGKNENGVKTGLYKEISDVLGKDLDTVAISFSDGMGGGSLFSGGSLGEASLEINITLKEKRSIKTSAASEKVYLAIKEYLTNQNLINEEVTYVTLMDSISVPMGKLNLLAALSAEALELTQRNTELSTEMSGYGDPGEDAELQAKIDDIIIKISDIASRLSVIGPQIAALQGQIPSIVTEINGFLSELSFATEVSASASSQMAGLVSDSITISFTGNSVDKINETLEAIQKECQDIDGILKFKNNYSPFIIQHVDKKPVVSLEIYVKDGYNLSKVQSQVDAKIAAMQKDKTIPEDMLRLEDGFSKELNETLSSLVIALIVAVILVFLVMVAMFQSVKLPFVVLMTIPLAFTGGLIALFLCGMQLSAVALIGLVILAGVVVNNGIVLVDYINQRRDEGAEIKEAVIEACNVRIKPILMTALTTILALVTMALGIGSNGELMQPLAIVSIGGLIYATALTLLVVPILYMIFCKRTNKPAKDNAVLVAEPAIETAVAAAKEDGQTEKQTNKNKKTE